MNRFTRVMTASVATAAIAASLLVPATANAQAPAAAPEPIATPQGAATTVPGGFRDVPGTGPNAQAASWLKQQGVSNGAGGPGLFSPNATVRRADMARFLYRLMGSPTVATPCEFTDLGASPDAELLSATCWLKANGITIGINNNPTTFGPNNLVTRSQMALFMFRMASESGVGDDVCGFTDLGSNPSLELREATCWLKENGVTKGTNPESTRFSPTQAVTRGQMALFLFRLAAAPNAWLPARIPSDLYPCEAINPTSCLLPFPSNTFTRVDATTDTGLRLDISPTATPANKDGKRIDPFEQNRNDGFSPGQVLLTYIPGAGLDQSDAAPITDIGKSVLDTSPVLVINASPDHPDYGDLHPHWVEYDDQATSDADRLLTVVPARNWEEGVRYIVVVRDLVTEGSAPIQPGADFREMLLGTDFGAPYLDERGERLREMLADPVLDRFETSGAIANLIEAWDFTVASERNLSERMLKIRDEGLGLLSEGRPAPTFNVPVDTPGTPANEDGRTRVTRPCPLDPSQTCTRTVVDGTFTVPNYQSGGAPIPGSAGAPFNWGSDGLPTRNTRVPNVTEKFRCVFPNDNVVSGASRAKVSLYGHGLLGSYQELSGTSDHLTKFADQENTVFCAASWAGFSQNDIGNAFSALQDLSLFNAIADGAQQGFLNQLTLGRLLRHPSGFVANRAFKAGGLASGQPLIDNSELGYDGNSQGGIMGAALTAVATDFTRAVLGVPGMNYSILLYRSSDWYTYARIFDPAYPNEIDRLQALGLTQILWDRAEGNGYAHHLTDDPLDVEGYNPTPAKEVMLHVAWADHQVAIVTADNMARTAGIKLYDPPAVATNRAALFSTPGLGDNPDVEPFWGIGRITPTEITNGYTGSVYVMWDSGNTPAPLVNRAPAAPGYPDVKGDPHENPRRAPGSARQRAEFLFGGQLADVCAPGPCIAPPR